MVTAQRPREALSGHIPAPAETAASLFPLRLQMPSEWKLTNENILDLCSLNDRWQIETDGEGGVIVMAPSGPLSSERSGRIYAQTLFWSDTTERGCCFESNALFELPNGDRRSPDASWISEERMAGLEADDEGVWHVCPDFVVEVRSNSDRLSQQQTKMEMWISQGARLGWLVDPYAETVWLYRPKQAPERLERPMSLTASEIADDLIIDFTRIWPTDRPERQTAPTT